MHPSNSSTNARILLVDDNKLGLVARKALLEEHGYLIHIAMEGGEALRQLEQDTFDLVITDYMMPRMNGVELIAKVRERKPGLPIVLISGWADGLGLTENNTGADAVVPKNANEVNQLVRVVGRLLNRPVPRKSAQSQRLKQRTRLRAV